MSARRDRFKLEIHQGEESRTLDIELDLEASPEDVWRALTEAEELVRWFPLQADSIPGVGGKISFGWDGEWESDLEIEVWEPQKHLRTTWPWTEEDQRGDEVSQVVVDYYIEVRSGGGTRLRLVHSGFPVGPEWDDIFDGTRRGWSYELRSLKHYLENHPGKNRRTARVRRPLHHLSEQQTWDLLWSAEGFLAGGEIDPLETGQRYSFTMPGGLELSGRILLAIPPTDLAATVDGVENSLLRVEIDQWSGLPNADLGIQLWLATWGDLKGQVEEIERHWNDMLDRLLKHDRDVA
jgi:uncharacterized protein YndB with AHSA1/START domain